MQEVLLGPGVLSEVEAEAARLQQPLELVLLEVEEVEAGEAGAQPHQ